MGASLPSGVKVCGRVFTEADLSVIRKIIASGSKPHRSEIARQTCDVLGWRRPDGRRKDMSCRVALLRLSERGLIELPPPTQQNGNRRRHRHGVLIDFPIAKVENSVRSIPGLALRPVTSTTYSRLWNSAIEKYHYLGHRLLKGAQIRYLVGCDTGLIAAIGFGAGAWKVAPRDRFIGWTKEQRETRLHLLVDNARFLILPGIECRNLASWILGECARRLPSDFEERYGYRPVLLETFVERQRFLGTCYRAAGWHYVGDTKGRGKFDRKHEGGLPEKRIFLRPLTPDFRERLCG